MLKSLQRRALKTHMLDRIGICICNKSSLQIDNLTNIIDFAIVFAVALMVLDQKQMFTEVIQSLKIDGLLLISEPGGHVSKEGFEKTLSLPQGKVMKLLDSPNINRSY
jgi:hypothetical protein